MGRIAGVTAAETRERLLRAAADVFARRGYEGTRVADIATAAGVSNGALYAHFGSKADVLVAALRTHGRRLLADLLAADPVRPSANQHRPLTAPARPTAEPVAESTAEPWAESTAEPGAESTAEPVAESTAEPVAESTAEPVAKPVTGPVADDGRLAAGREQLVIAHDRPIGSPAQHAVDRDHPVAELLLEIGRRLPRRRDARGYLIVEALVAARRDAAVARPMRDYISERADWLAQLVSIGQAGAEIDPALSPEALAHFCLLLAMGSALVTPDLHAVDEDEWAALLGRLVAALAPAKTAAKPAPRPRTAVKPGPGSGAAVKPGAGPRTAAKPGPGPRAAAKAGPGPKTTGAAGPAAKTTETKAGPETDERAKTGGTP